MHLSLHFRVPLYEHNSLIIFDEVQFFPPAREAIKYLVADGRYSYIETGSSISINQNVKDILIPSEERRIKMYPMDFEEFLWAMGEEMLMPYIRECFNRQQPLSPGLHRRAMDYFRQYMIVGGMPQAVETYINTKSFEQTDRIKRDILNLYRSDIRKYAKGVESKVVKIFDTIPGQLQKHEKKISSLLTETARPFPRILKFFSMARRFYGRQYLLCGFRTFIRTTHEIGRLRFEMLYGGHRPAYQSCFRRNRYYKRRTLSETHA